MSTSTAVKGLEGIVAANSGICWIDGDAGVLAYRGINIHELAEKSTFEETTFLLWNGKLPTQAELEQFKIDLAEARNKKERLAAEPRQSLQKNILAIHVRQHDVTDDEIGR